MKGALRTTGGALPPFDYLVFFVRKKVRGLVLPSGSLTKGGKTFSFYKNDTEGYPRGLARKMFSKYAFDLAPIPSEQRAAHFVQFSRRCTLARAG